MSAETVRCWLVDRNYNDKGMITLTYATTDGRKKLRRHRAASLAVDATAAIDVEPDRLVDVDDTEERDRFADEASRMASRHEPDDTV